jgi:hypothetical protein
VAVEGKARRAEEEGFYTTGTMMISYTVGIIKRKTFI